MRWLLGFLVFVFVMQSGIAQNTSINPFDLPDRLPDSLQNIQMTPTGELQAAPLPEVTPTVRSYSGGSHFAIWFLPLLLCLVAWALSMDRTIIQSLYRSVNNLNFLNLMHRDQRTRLTPALVVMYLVFLGSTAFFVRYGLAYFTHEMPPFVYVLLGILAIYMVRTLVMRLIHYAFNGPIEVAQYDYTIFIFCIVLGLILLPLNLLIAFSPDSLAVAAIWGGIVIAILLFLFRSFRGILLSSSHLSRNTFRYFMYICTLEIAPILLIIKELGVIGHV